MLNSLRKATTGWTAKILLGLLVISFAVWGIGDVFRSGNQNAVLSVGETDVPLAEYALTYNQASSGIARQLGRPLTPEEAATFGIDQAVLSQLVSGAVLTEQARNIGLGISDERLARLIADDPSFQDASGNFSRAQFRNLLNQARLRESDYIEFQEDAAMRTQIVDAVSNGITLPKAYEEALGLFNGERRNVSYISVGPGALESEPEPSDEALQAYFEENKQDYAAPEYRGLAVARLTRETIADESAITDEQVAADYEQYQSRYGEAERRQVSQIVFGDEAAATEAAEKLANGATFENVARAAGKNPADTAIGLVTREDIPDPSIRDAAFALESGQTSDVIDGRFGPTIVRVSEIQEASVTPLEEVAGDIRRDLALNNASDTLNAAYQTYEDARASGATFEEATQEAGLKVETYEAVDSQGRNPSGEAIEGISGNGDLLEEAFQTEPGFDNIPITTEDNGYLFFDVTDIQPARDRTLDEVRQQVVDDWTRDETLRLVEERAAALAEEARGGKSLENIAEENGLEVASAVGITRQSGAGEIGAQASQAAFASGQGSVAAAKGRGELEQVVLKIDEVAPPAAPLDNVNRTQIGQVQTGLTNDLVQSYVTRVQGEYPLQIYPNGIENAKSLMR
ncbi:peptidyl-prolyl cis-trans isomerase D [Fulvimarina pelagi HTCC2506]|uniref:Parvulin-like PPIase n=1 Tax=Fulvimarina pelagi HTCC2506 TaxID=314231 RepID=Q0FZ52_9HYPH|nr:SurA N-terminal domain-containing protein [Fulvimarina pelagi]EAU40106.1 peptidyl-prolyl cis-trans isomerase D [Fulvimarina pelagi HTCC2506]